MATPLTHSEPWASSMPLNPADEESMHVPGYPRLAYWFAKCPRYLQLRRFSRLSVRFLLHRQHELAALEKKLLLLEQELEKEEATRKINRDYGYVIEDRQDEVKALFDLMEEGRNKLKEYEESLIRFDTLGSKSCDSAALTDVRRWLTQAVRLSLCGIDASVWGSLDNPSGAQDLVQVLQPEDASPLGRYLRSHTFWNNKRPDHLQQYIYNASSFEYASLMLGNVLTSLLVYAAVTSLAFVDKKSLKVVIVIAVAFVISLCSICFKNQQFIVMLATTCAVLAGLLANTDGKGR